MSKKLFFLISFVLLLSLGSSVLAEDMNEPIWAGADNTGVVYWEFLEDINEPTRMCDPTYYYPPSGPPEDSVFAFRVDEFMDNSNWVWIEGGGVNEDGAMSIEPEASLVQPFPDFAHDYVTIYAQITWKGTGGVYPYLTFALEIFEDPFGGYLGGQYNELTEAMPPTHEHDLGNGWKQGTYVWSTTSGAAEYAHVLFFGQSWAELLIDEVVVDVKRGFPGGGPGHTRCYGPTRPRPRDGQMRVDPNGLRLIWDPDPESTEEIVYFSSDFNDVDLRSEDANGGHQDANYWPQAGDLNEDVNLGDTYYWAIDEDIPGSSIVSGSLWQFTVKEANAAEPSPEDDANAGPCTTLKWDPGAWAVSHRVFLDVNEARVTARAFDPCATPTDPCWAPPWPLDWDTQYFWVVDEVNAGDVCTPGEVWSFTVRSDPCDGPDWRGKTDTFYAYWGFKEDWGAGKTVAEPNQIVPGGTPWEPNCVDQPAAWMATHTPPGGSSRSGIADNFDGVWQAYGDNSIRLKHTDNAAPGQNVIIRVGMIWSGTGETSPEITLSRLTNFENGPTIGTGEDPLGAWWEEFEDAGNFKDTNDFDPLFTIQLCDGWMYSLYETEYLLTVPADNIHVVIGTSGQFYLDSVVVDAHWYTPPQAHGPKPEDEAVDVPLDTCKITWYPGADVNDHNVYFSEIEAEVADACASARVGNRQDTNNYPTGADCLADVGKELEPGKTYYWRVDEVNDACSDSPWTGEVWSFTTVQYVIIDDFEKYTDTDNHMDLRAAWDAKHSNFTWGTRIYLETTPNPYHEEYGTKAMRLKYRFSDGPTLETRLAYDDPCDWTERGTVALALWFYGDANEWRYTTNFIRTADDMYVTLKDDDGDSNTIYYVADSGGDVNDLIAKQWMEWNLSLQDFNEANNVNPEKIRSITIGVVPKAGTDKRGNISFDDIRLYVRRCVPEFAVDISGPEGVPDCYVDEWDLEAMFEDWLVSDTYVQSVALSDANLLVHYAFDPCGPYDDQGDPWDSSGNNYHGIGINEPNIHAGILTLSGANSVEIGGDFNDINPFSGAIKGGGDFTIAMKFKTAENSVLFSSCPYDPGVVEPPNDSMPSNHAMHIFIFNPGGAEEPTVNHDNWYIDVATSYASDSIMDGQWHHVATTYDVDTNDHVVYLDGVPGVVSSFDPNLVNPTTHSIRIGNTRHEIMPWGEGMGSVPMTGDIDEVYVFDRVLSHGEIVNLAGTTIGQWFYAPVPSDAELYTNKYGDEPEGQRFVNFKDYAVLMDYWLQWQLYPSED